MLSIVIIGYIACVVWFMDENLEFNTMSIVLSCLMEFFIFHGTLRTATKSSFDIGGINPPL